MKKAAQNNPKKIGLYLALFGALILAVLLVPSIKWTNHNVSALAVQHNSKVSPVILLPGSSASQNRFDSLIKGLNAVDNQQHSLLKLTVSKTGKITYTGHIKNGDLEPFIVVGFENNKDGYDNIKQQAKWFAHAIQDLMSRYQFNNFKGIGHSNGGLIYTAYLENEFDSDDLTIKRLMTIGTPYNFSEKSINHVSQMLAAFIKNRNNIPKTLNMYSVAGTEDFESDGLVPSASVEAGKYIYQGQAKHYTEITVTGQGSQHSDLPQNDQIISLIKEYILDSNLVGNSGINTSK